MTPKLTIKQQIESDLQRILPTATITTSSIDGVDYQCNACFAIAKQISKNPMELAKEVAQKFNSSVASVTATAPAFLNFVVNDEALLVMGMDVVTSGKLTLPVTEKPQIVFFDYGCANIAKELHAGHLRSPIIGEALRRVFNAFDHKTIGCTYLGDWGLQIGLIIAQLQEEGLIKNDKLQGETTLELLNEYYPKASKRKGVEPNFKRLAEEITVKMQNLEEPYISLWREIRRVSVDKIRESYLKLNCTFDYYNGESNAEPYVDVVMKILEDKGLTYSDKDCILIDVKEDGEHVPIPKKTPDEPQRYERPMPPVILKKGNGGDLYATSDVATTFYRYRDHKPNEFVYVSDFRQELHFTQFFRIVKNGGIVPQNTKFTSIGYGAMLGADGKPFKTRAGGTIRLEEIIGFITDAAKKRLVENGRDDLTTAEKIGISALKFGDLQNHVRRDYIFDMEKALQFEGKTGPYMLYTVARINSIFEKINHDEREPTFLKGTRASAGFLGSKPELRNIYLRVLQLSDSYLTAMQNYTLNGLVDAVYELAKSFNLFYANTNILKEQDENKRAFYLSVCAMVRTVIKFALNTLAIETVEKM